jgi:hypothetical protein
MPWWAWLLLDLFLVGASAAFVVVIGVRFYRLTRMFLTSLGQLDVPKVERPVKG